MFLIRPNGASSGGFSSWGAKKKKGHGLRSGVYGVLSNHWNSFFRQNLVDKDGRMTRGIVMVKHPSGQNVWSDTKHSLSKPFKDFFIKNLLDSLAFGHNICVNNPSTAKEQISIDLIFYLLSRAFFGSGEVSVHRSLLWRFVSGSYSKIHKSSPVTTRLKKPGSFSILLRRSRHKFFRLSFCLVEWFFGTNMAHTFFMPKYWVKRMKDRTIRI